MAMDGGAAVTSSGVMDIDGMPVGNGEAPVLGSPVLAASRASSAGAMSTYSIIDIREQATLDHLCLPCDGKS